MARVCICNRYRPGQPYDKDLDCAICYLYHTDRSYRDIQDAPNSPFMLVDGLPTSAYSYPRGLGDTAHATLSFFQRITRWCYHLFLPEKPQSKVATCGGCSKRRQFLNKAVPYPKDPVMRKAIKTAFWASLFALAALLFILAGFLWGRVEGYAEGQRVRLRAGRYVEAVQDLGSTNPPSVNSPQ